MVICSRKGTFIKSIQQRPTSANITVSETTAERHPPQRRHCGLAGFWTFAPSFRVSGALFTTGNQVSKLQVTDYG